MSTSVAVAITLAIAILGLGYVVGRLLALRSRMLRETGPAATEVDPDDLGLSRSGPTVLHFTAEWCGPCAAVRRVVDEVCAELPAVTHVEIDMDANPSAAQRLSVLSLPTTFIFDADGRQRYRTSAVPKADELRSALQALLA